MKHMDINIHRPLKILYNLRKMIKINQMREKLSKTNQNIKLKSLKTQKKKDIYEKFKKEL